MIDKTDFHTLITFRKGIGNPTSTHLMSKISFDTLMSVSCFKTSLSFFLPSSVSGLYFNGMSRTTFGFPDAYSTMIFTFSEFLNLHIVAVDSNILPLKIFFPIILFINVDFPELVSPEKLH